MFAIKIFLLLCQIQGGELTHCSPPHQGQSLHKTAGWQPPGPTWQVRWETWDSCAQEASRKNALAYDRRYGGGSGWAFMCYASDAVAD
jgi:hypothetical protein